MPRKHRRVDLFATHVSEVATSLGYSRSAILRIAREHHLGQVRTGCYLTDCEVKQVAEILGVRRKYGERRA